MFGVIQHLEGGYGMMIILESFEVQKVIFSLEMDCYV